ncbi:MAG TPA: hypothetical protein VHA54_08545 [Solirubrobacterales bacterium]|nr:hypothetical protein [Solirubrobacterales bacterium]
MSSPESLDLRCQISSLEEPIHGRVSDEQGRSLPFWGWIELAAVLTSLVEEAKRQHDPPQEGTAHE